MHEDHESLRVLGDPVRLGIVALLAESGERCACELLSEFSITQPTLSHHMKALREADLVSTRKEGTWIHYALIPGELDRLAGVLSAYASRARQRETSREGVRSCPAETGDSKREALR